MRVLVTGGSGFIARNIVPILSGEHEIYAPTRSELDIQDADTVRSFVVRHRIEAIVHAAAAGVSRTEPDTIARNTRMFESVAACAPLVRRLILFGSGAEYDKSKPIIRVREDAAGRAQPSDDYGNSKRAIARRAAGIPNAVVLRVFGVFGPYEDVTRRFISLAILSNLRGEPIVIRQDVVFSYTWVLDLAQVVNHMLASPTASGAYNIVPDESVRLTEIAQIVNEFADTPSEIRVLSPGLNLEYTGDNTRLREEMPGLSFTPLRDAVRTLMTYYRPHP